MHGVRNMNMAWWIIALTTMIYTFMFIMFPYSCDDLGYKGMLDANIAETGSWWKGYFETVYKCAFTHNLRLGNILFTLVTLLPKWVGAVVSGLALWYTLYKMARLAAPRGVTPAVAVWICVLYTFLMPWHDGMMMQDFCFNYILPSALVMWILGKMLDDRSHNAVAMLAAGLVCGMWHEGISIPLAAGLIALAAVRRDKVTVRKTFWCCLGLAAGILILLQAPGLWKRLGDKSSKPWSRIAVFLLVHHVTDYTFLLLWLMAIWRKGKKMAGNPRIVTLAAITVTCIAINAYTRCEAPHGYWIGYTCSIIGITYLWRKIGPFRNGRIGKVLTILAGVWMTVHLVGATYMSVEVKRDVEHVYQVYESGQYEDNVIFADYTISMDAPVFLLLKPGYYALTHYGPYVEHYYNNGRKLNVVPKELEYVHGTEGEAMPSGIRHYRGKWYGPNTMGLENWKFVFGTVLTDRGKVNCQFKVTAFRSKGDGKKYISVEPMASYKLIGADIRDFNW